jgi:hypothetical protein
LTPAIAFRVHPNPGWYHPRLLFSKYGHDHRLWIDISFETGIIQPGDKKQISGCLETRRD